MWRCIFFNSWILLSTQELWACPLCATNLGRSTVYRWPTVLLILSPLILLGVLGWSIRRLLKNDLKQDHPDD
ncbi:MAG: hypothetical protein HYY44_02395 [Deltaproteobacteria bacterium]|nr:hypothetical protein [Deltaproteobacteria bacterium]MBI4373402.1 hypothetical protein [Deltaproteobacteria bacterium]